MLGRLKILTVLLCFVPYISFGAVNETTLKTEENTEFYSIGDWGMSEILDMLKELNWDESDNSDRKAIYQQLESLVNDINNVNQDISELQNQDENALNDKKDAYEEAKANEQSLANRTLTAASIAATGIGGMELAMGLSEQKADKAAEQDMSAYIASFRCEYGNGKQVKAGPEEIVLPGGNDEKLMSLRTKYMTLATDLKERKTALGMKPGIESEEILDKTAMNLYDDENTGIESGAYGSLYRAKMLGSEEDQAKLDEEAEKSKKRVTVGAIAAGAGIVGGIAGNMAINGVDNKKQQLDNKITNVMVDRNKVTSTLYNYLQSEIDTCNAIIDENKELVEQIKTSSPEKINDEDFVDLVTKVESAEYLQSFDDIIKLKDHPLCD